MALTAVLAAVFVSSGWWEGGLGETSAALALALLAANTLPLLAVRRNPLAVVLVFSVAYRPWVAFELPAHELPSLPTLAAMYALGNWDRPLRVPNAASGASDAMRGAPTVGWVVHSSTRSPDAGGDAMTHPLPMVNSLADYTIEDLEALERERPELGRVELLDGALHATGESALGIPHQLVVQRLYLLLAPLCPPGLVVMLDTWWHYVRARDLSGKIRADLAAYRLSDLPDGGKVFRRHPLVAVEILSDDAVHDLVAKDGVYAEHGTRRAYLDPDERFGWWCRLDGTDSAEEQVTWQLDGWPPLSLQRSALLAPPTAGVTAQ